ncbi:MAG: hypothetical protein KAJ79_00610 [Candidatus Omnitrophica bacterium]|nr:hypothetical protein [Candidatus Omnitrophota bacterium]
MKNKIIAIIIGLGFVGILFLLFNSDKRIIKKNLGQLVEIATKEKNDNNFIFIVKVKKLKSLFKDDCIVKFKKEVLPEIKKLDELLVVYSQLYKFVEEVEIELSDVSIVTYKGNKDALTKLKGKSIVKVRQGEQYLFIEQNVELRWIKENNKWKVFEIKGINLK